MRTVLWLLHLVGCFVTIGYKLITVPFIYQVPDDSEVGFCYFIFSHNSLDIVYSVVDALDLQLAQERRNLWIALEVSHTCGNQYSHI